MSAITSTNVAQTIMGLVAQDVQPALVGSLVMGNLVRRDFDAVVAQHGDTVNVPITPSMSANDIGETGTVQTQNPTTGNAQIVLDRHKEATFKIPDVTKLLAQPDLLGIYMQPAVIALAEAIETDLLSLYAAFSVNTAVGTGGVALTEGVIDSAEKTLFSAKVPVNAQKYLVVDADAYSDLRQIERFSEASTSGTPEAIISGTVGRIKDFSVFRSQYVQEAGGTTYNLAFARNAMALVMRRLPQPMPGTGALVQYVEFGGFGFRLVMSYDPNTLAQQFTVDVLYGVGGIEKRHGVQVLS